MSKEKQETGYVYILTNPSFREDWVKIGVMGTGTLVHSLGSMNLSPMILSNQAKKLLNNKKLPKSLAVSFIFLTFATTFARVMGTGTLVHSLWSMNLSPMI